MIKIKPTAWLTFLALWGLGAFLAAQLLAFDLLGAAITGLAFATIHWLVLIVHHAGHSLAAKATGFPMTGVLLWWGLATSLYPRDEPDLPASLHIRRAVGGPISSLAFGFFAGALAWLLHEQSIDTWRLAAFAALDSLVIFGVGSLVPLGFNDGSTLIKWSTSRTRDRAA